MIQYDVNKISNWFAEILISLCIGSIALSVILLVGLLGYRAIENPAVGGYSVALLVCAIITGKIIRRILDVWDVVKGRK